MYGWNGQKLCINLDEGLYHKEKIPEKWLKDFIGGRGLNSRTLFDLITPSVKPFDPENCLIFAVGPVTGTLVPSSGRSTFTALSPLALVDGGTSPCFGDSNAGGDFGPEVKYAGYDQIIMKGKAKSPVYIWIDDGKVEIRSAEHFWGMDTYETQNIIKRELGDEDVQVACIGPAGENLVRMSCIITGGGRAWGKAGLGAVMGSKNLKAIAVRGSGSVKIADPEELKKVVSKAIDILYQDPSSVAYSELGTAVLVEAHQRAGRLGTRNFQDSQYEDWEKINADAFSEYWHGKKACSFCPLHCGHYFSIDMGPNKGLSGEMPEYVTIAAFGSKVGNSDKESILVAGELCNKLGLDTMNTGGTIAWAMECWQKGIFIEKDTEGLNLEWGNVESILELVKKIAYRSGSFGDLLAEGAYRAAKKVGKNSEDWVIHAKGQDPALGDPRSAKAWGLGCAVASRGGCHLRALPSLETYFTAEEAKKMFGTEEAVAKTGVRGKGKLIIWCENQRAVSDCLEICKFNVRTKLAEPKWMTMFLNAVAGTSYTDEDIMKVGERIINIERAFNVRQGLTRKDDTLCKRFLEEPITSGPSKGEVCNLEPMLDEYYEFRKWDIKTGLQLKKTLNDLGLEEIADELLKLGKIKE
ncbi:MAG: aldehyde ferredoxin oxidoreductase family protein [Candidatus Lokiarchaeota archaeon]|nr:aldehyde ferredoxin oxidoreductase family protein [Candidatus Lokiarchaeota archaeon]